MANWDVAQELEGNEATAEFMACPGSAWLLLSFSLFPVRHPSLAVSNPQYNFSTPERSVVFSAKWIVEGELSKVFCRRVGKFAK